MSVLGKIKTVLNALIRRGYWYDNVFMPDSRKFSVYSTFNTRVVNLGSTSALAAFDYTGLGVKGANWALRRNPLNGDLAVLKNYSSFLDQEKSTVIIPLCPFSALSGSYEPFEDRYYAVLYPTTIPGYSYVHGVQANEKITNPVLHYPWYALFQDIWHLLENKNTKSLSEECMVVDAKNRMKGWLHEFSLKEASSPLSLVNKYNIEEALNALQGIVDYCKIIHATPVLVVPPMYHTLSSLFTEESRKNLFGDIESLAERNNIQFINYMDDKSFVNERSLFRDSYLLNKRGAQLFTKKVLNELSIK